MEASDSTPQGSSPQDYGQYSITGAQILSMPQVTPRGIDWFATPPPESRSGFSGGAVFMDIVRNLKRKFLGGDDPPPKRQVPAQHPAAPAISSVGVMDVGAGNCNMLIASADNEPVVYFDTGFPIWVWVSTAPNTIRLGPNYRGPILQNHRANPDMRVILSHWDMDHYRLAVIAPGLRALPWLFPDQNAGGVDLNFRNSIPLANRSRYNGAPIWLGPGYNLYQCDPGALPAAAIMNNSGTAMEVFMRLPTADPNTHSMLLTADGNVTSLPVGAQLAATARMTGMTGVHHGASTFNANVGLIQPVVPYAAAGYVVYSSGITAHGTYAYGHPTFAAAGVAGAGGTYRAAGYTTQRSTAEGPNVRVVPLNVAQRGNVRLGDQTALNAGNYGNTAFANFLMANRLT